MDIIKDIVGNKATDLLNALGNQGFSADSAQRFLGESGNSIMSALKSGNFDLGQGNLQEKASTIIGNIDIANLAAKVGISSEMATTGLTTVVPSILSALQGKLGGAKDIMSLIGMADSDKLLGGIKKFF